MYSGWRTITFLWHKQRQRYIHTFCTELMYIMSDDVRSRCDRYHKLRCRGNRILTTAYQDTIPQLKFSVKNTIREDFVLGILFIRCGESRYCEKHSCMWSILKHKTSIFLASAVKQITAKQKQIIK